MKNLSKKESITVSGTLLILITLPIAINLAFNPPSFSSRAYYEKSCQLQMPPAGSYCRNGNPFEGECQIVHCPRGCGGEKSCSLSDPGAYRTIENCETARLEPEECGQIDTVDSAQVRKYCRVDGYCDYTQIRCLDTCKGPEKPKNGDDDNSQDADVNLTPTVIPPLYISATPYALSPLCSCDSMIYEGSLGAGATADFILYANVYKPELFSNMNMKYYLEKDGQIIAASGSIPAEQVDFTPDFYKTRWSATLPEAKKAIGDYKVWGKIECSPQNAFDLNAEKNVLGVQSNSNKLALTSLIDFFRVLLGLNPLPKPSTNPRAEFDLTGTISVLRPTGVSSLQLGTFLPKAINIVHNCDNITFTIPKK